MHARYRAKKLYQKAQPSFDPYVNFLDWESRRVAVLWLGHSRTDYGMSQHGDGHALAVTVIVGSPCPASQRPSRSRVTVAVAQTRTWWLGRLRTPSWTVTWNCRAVTWTLAPAPLPQATVSAPCNQQLTGYSELRRQARNLELPWVRQWRWLDHDDAITGKIVRMIPVPCHLSVTLARQTCHRI